MVPNRERSASRQYNVTLLVLLICRVHHAKCQTGEAQAGIKNAGRNINNLRYADDTTLMAEIKELKSLLMKVKEEGALKLSIQKMKIIYSVPLLHGR